MILNHLLLLLIPLLPLAGFIIIGWFNKKLGQSVAGFIASSVVFVSFLISLFLFYQISSGQVKAIEASFFDWITAGNLKIGFSFLVDPLSAVMLLVITGVGFLIHVYSIGYMHHDEDFPRFFAYLNLFVFFMLLLVMGNNYVVMFAGWEGVGLCSYLLIGFWFKNTSYNHAARKAFVMNRIGDLGFLLGMFLMFQKFGSLEFNSVFESASHVSTGDSTVTAICILLFIGAMGKSAQIPLFTWLPDAMAGPTPVSALIHAATMVTAGIYMVARSNILYTLSPVASELVAIVGVCTAVFAATIGLKQNDIKKVLAYSTVSQLGYMFVALGAGAYTTGMFHVVTHAFFKALLFLGAGSVIHAMSGEQDIRHMGGLRKHLPVTHFTFLIGVLAISGFPFFSGFFSKDEILTSVYGYSFWMFLVLSVTSVLTAVYMFRLYWLTFWGEFRGTKHQHEHLHESPATITVPLIILAILSFAGGYIGMPHLLGGHHYFSSFLGDVVVNNSVEIPSHRLEIAIIIATIIVLALVIFIGYKFYVSKGLIPESDIDEKGYSRVLSHKYYVDEFYDAVISKPLKALSGFANRFIEQYIIDGVVNGVGWIANNSSAVLRLVQTGNASLYILMMVVGLILVLVFKLML